jgi:hypothetical protein
MGGIWAILLAGVRWSPFPYKVLAFVARRREGGLRSPLPIVWVKIPIKEFTTGVGQ